MERIKEVYKDYFRIGVAVEHIHEPFVKNEIGNPEKEKFIAEQFNSMTFGNELKDDRNMGFMSPEATEEYLPFCINDGAKKMLDWARENKMPVRGHVLVWHSQCPREVFCKGYKAVTIPTPPEKLKENPMLARFEKLDPVCFVSRETMLKRMESYIFSVMEYMYANDYARTIYAWDVVNEAIELEDKTETGLRNSYWYQVIGDDFIYWAFKFAKAAVTETSKKYAEKYGVDASDEEALKAIQPKLFYNDYNEFQPAKKEAIIGALTREGHGHGSIVGEKLIDAVGMQGHISDNNDIDEYITALKDYDKLVPEVHITEFDVKCTCTNKNQEYYQAVFFKNFFEALIKARKEGVNLTTVTFWGLTDDNSWIHGANPLLFHGDLTPKKCFDAMIMAVRGGDLGEPERIEIDLSKHIFDFEVPEGKEIVKLPAGRPPRPEDLEAIQKNPNIYKPEDIGFKAKGFTQINFCDTEAHSGKYSMACEHRFGGWSGISYDASDFIGQTVVVTAWVKSPAEAVTLSLDAYGEGPALAEAVTRGEWSELSATFKIPCDVHSAILSFGTKEAEPDKFNAIYVDDMTIEPTGLYESFEDKANIAAIRGAGHLPFLFVTDKEAHTAGGHSLCVTRQEKDATVKLNISSYIGYKVEFTAFVKTSDKEIRIGLDGNVPQEWTKVSSDGEWTELKAVAEIPKDLRSAEVYIETDGNAEFFVDDVVVKLA